MKKIITLVLMACMITSCTGLKPDEIVKADTPDNISSTRINNSKDPEQGKNEKQEGSQY